MIRFLSAMMLLTALAGPASAQFDHDHIKIGVLTDMTGPFRDTNGRGSVEAVRQAVQEMGGTVAGRPVEVISADMGTSIDQAVAIAHKWIDTEQVDAIVDVPSSAAALAISDYVHSKNRVFLATGPGTARLTGESCSPNTVHWTFDTYAFSNAATRAMVASGGDTWYFITADYIFGQDLQAASTQMIQQMGGKVLGASVHPINNADFSSQLLTAQSAHPQVIALANGPTDAGNTLKQAAEFGMLRPGGPKFIALSMTPLDVEAIGQETAAGLFLVAPFYWNLNDDTRAFSERFALRMGGRMPIFAQAGAYSATLHYLKAVAAAKTDHGDAVVRMMKAMPTDDQAFGHGSVREDGRKLHPFYLFTVKPKAESQSAQDLLSLTGTIPADQAFRPMADGGCRMAASP